MGWKNCLLHRLNSVVYFQIEYGGFLKDREVGKGMHFFSSFLGFLLGIFVAFQEKKIIRIFVAFFLEFF